MPTDVEPVTVRPVEDGLRRQAVLQMTTPTPSDALYRGYRALFDIGIRIVHTRLRLSGSDTVQTLYLAELNGVTLDQLRTAEALAVLNCACGRRGRDAYVPSIHAWRPRCMGANDAV
jgi:hypothetical protein